MSSKLQMSMNTLIDLFYFYSGKEGDKYKLSKQELKKLLEVELSFLLENNKDNAAVNGIMNELDEDSDGQVDFKEFVFLVISISVACADFYEYFDKHCQEMGIPEAFPNM